MTEPARSASPLNFNPSMTCYFIMLGEDDRFSWDVYSVKWTALSQVSVLACLALHAFLVVSKLMLQSESHFSCCRCTSLSTVMCFSAGGCWGTVGLLALAVFPGASC